MHSVWSEKLKERHNLEEPGINQMILKVDVIETGCEGVKWIHLAHDRDQWQAPVNIIINKSLCSTECG
jgi:hypothetical protein